MSNRQKEAEKVRTAKVHETGRLDVSSLVLIAILLAAGFILNMTVGKALAITGIQPEFVISAYCLAILLLRPKVSRGVLIGILAATVIQITTSIPGLEYLCDIPASALMAALVLGLGRGDRTYPRAFPMWATFLTTSVSGLIFASMATVVVLGAPVANIVVMFPVVFGTGIANALVVGALYPALSKVVRHGSETLGTEHFVSETKGTEQTVSETKGTGQPEAQPLAGARAQLGAQDSLQLGAQDSPQLSAQPKANETKGSVPNVSQLKANETKSSVPNVSETKSSVPIVSVPVEVQHLSFTYSEGERLALDDISLSLAPGEFLGVIGPSGAGKTTLASALAGAIPHHFAGEMRGAVLVDGKDTCDIALTDVSRMVGSVLQDIDAQMVASNVEDEMLYGLENFGVDHEQIPARVAEALATCGISDLAHREIATLSGGQKQKVAIAAILALRPSVIVLDEPTAALDPASSTMVFDTLRELNRAGMTVVVIEQKVALLSEYCDRVAVLSEGKLALLGTPREVFSHSAALRKLGVDSPRVTRVSNKLAADGLSDKVCLTVDEAHELIAGLVGDRGRTAARGPQDAEPPAHDVPVTPQPGRHAGEPVLTFDDVSFSYGPGMASVDHLSFQVHPGELVGFVGQNGAGKTTATKLMNGLLKPSSGRVNICGLDTSSARTSEIAHHVSTLFQNPDRQICKNTVVEEVAFSLELLGVDEETALERARDTVDYFGLPADAAPFSLSRGQRQIVALASVVVTNPDVLILDEPTSGLDYRECMVVMDAVNAARERGCAVVMVCHDMEVASDFATRLVVMAHGRILADGNPAQIFRNDELLRQAYVSAPQIAQLSERLAADVSPAFNGATEVSSVVRVTEGMVA